MNSLQHQAGLDVPESLIVTGKAKDGMIEALESKDHKFIMSIQWHPEALSNREDKTSLSQLNGFIEASKQK